MVKKELEIIVNAELEAQNIIKEARNRAILGLERAKAKAEETKETARALSLAEGQQIVNKARIEATAEAEKILNQANLDAKKLKEDLSAKIPGAKQLWQ